MKAVIFDFNRTLYDPKKEILVEGALQLLQFLRQKGLKLALVSTGGTKRKKQITSFTPFFDVIYVVPSKTPSLFLNIIKKLDISASQTLVVGDYLADEISIGKRLGMLTVYTSAYALPQCSNIQPDFVIYSLTELASLFPYLQNFEKRLKKP